jgi:hypothetical protein
MEISRFPCQRLPRMPGSTTTRGQQASCDIDARRVAFCGTENIGTPNLSYAAPYLACVLPCERFTSALASNRASLGAGVARYAFTVTDFHRLPSAGLPAHPSTTSGTDPEGNWSAWVDLNHRSPGSKPGRDGHAPLHAGDCAHGRSRTCTSLVREQELYPVELRVHDCSRHRDPNSGLPAETGMPRDVRGELGSPTRIRTWIDRLTTGRPTVGRSGNGGAPRTRTEPNLLAREIRGPCTCPIGFA